MSLFDVEPNEFTKPIKPYATLSHAQNAKRLNDMYWRLVGKVLLTAVELSAARSLYQQRQPDLLFEEQRIDAWEAEHRVTPRRSVRSNAKIYDWGSLISPRRYRKMLIARRERLQNAIVVAEAAHDEACLALKARAEFIRRGQAWLNTNPSKIAVVTETRTQSFFDVVLEADGGRQIVVRDVEVEGAAGIERRDIVSRDADEIVVCDEREGRGIRKRAGWLSKAAMHSQALLGDHVRLHDSFQLVGKCAERGYLDAAISYHFFAAGTRPSDDYKQFHFDSTVFARHRAEITRAYRDPGDPYEGLRFVIRGSGVDARYHVKDRVYYSDGSKPYQAKVGLQHRQSETIEPHLAQFRPQHRSATRSSLKGRSCDPELWIREADEFGYALHALDDGGSFILTGAAGTGKTHMIPGFISWCLANDKSVKVLAGGGALDVIEERCRHFMQRSYKIEVPMFWAREQDYLIFGGFDEQEAFRHCRNPSAASDILRRSKLVRPHNDEADVLIIDEATLVPFDAEIFKRSKQIMVIGDLFQIARAGSVFEVAAASHMQVFRLRRNFRASNCDIMTWSNIFSYNNALVVKNRGMRKSELRYVPLGRKQTGVVRAEAIAIANAARHAAGKGESVGIVAFNKKQLKAISDALRNAGAPHIAFRGLPEEVQGKEADCVLVSLGAALTQSGRLPSEIAGLNDDQAIMKMNVALSRARGYTMVFSSLLSSDIDLRHANDAQAMIASVLETFERLPTQQQTDADPLFNRSVC